MSTDNNGFNEELMDNVEKRLRQHVKDKKQRVHIGILVSFFIIAIIVPSSVYAYNKYCEKIPFKQEVDLARQNNNITQINETFKYKNVDFKIKEVVADENGMEVVYETSNPKYSISGFNLKDSSKKNLPLRGYSMPGPNLKEKEKAFYIVFDKDEAKHIRDNPIILNLSEISYNVNEDDGKFFNEVWNKFNSFMGIKNDSFKVDWNLKMRVAMQEIKSIPINKEFNLNIGKLKLISLNKSVLKTIIKYDFISSDKNIYQIRPLFSIRIDSEYINNILEKDGERICPSSINSGSEEVKSIYYKKVNELGIRLVGATTCYGFDNSKEYEIDKDKLPMECEFEGEKFKVVSVEEKKDCIEYSVEFSKTNKIYNTIHLKFGDGSGNSGENEKVSFKDQEERNKIYNNLIKKIPDLNFIYSNAGELEGGIFNAQVKATFYEKNKKNKKFRVDGATKSFVYDTDEIIIKP